MRTGILHPMRVWKRLCVYVLRGKQSIYFWAFWKRFGFVGYIVKQNVVLNIVFGFVVLNSIWEHTLNVFLTFFRRRRRHRRPLSVRPSRRRRPSSVRPSRRPSRRRRRPSSSSSVVRRRPSSSSVVVRLNITCKTSLKHPSDRYRYV